MNSSNSLHVVRALACLVAALGIAPSSLASKVGGPSAPAASAVQTSVQQPASAQSDESASLRQGTVTALDESGARLQVQGVWLGVVAGKTLVLRQGKAARLDSIKPGDVVRFMVAPGTDEGAPSLRVLYAP